MVMRYQGLASRSGGCEVEVRSIKEYAGRAERNRQPWQHHKVLPVVGGEEAMDILIVPPSPQAVENGDFVPESAAGINRGDVRHRQICVSEVLGYVGNYRSR